MHAYHGWPFLTSPEHPDLTAFTAFLIRGGIALLVVLPLVLRSRMRVRIAALAFLAGPALDLDHVVAAGSFRARALEDLGHRPFTHSLLFALVLTFAAFALTRRGLVAWAVFAVIASHLLYDAAGGGEYWLYPLRHPDSVPWLLFPTGFAAMFALSVCAARKMPPRERELNRAVSTMVPRPD